MKIFMNSKFLSAALMLSLFALSACGTRFTGTYNLTQQGGQFQSNPACSQITLSINENSNQISGQGQNQCFTETLQGTMSSSGQANVTLSVYSSSMGGQTNWTNGYNPNNSYQNAGGMGCSYQGMLTISGNTITGSLSPTGNCMGQGMITINGTRN